jgi:hypothetical protein
LNSSSIEEKMGYKFFANFFSKNFMIMVFKKKEKNFEKT